MIAHSHTAAANQNPLPYPQESAANTNYFLLSMA